MGEGSLVVLRLLHRHHQGDRGRGPRRPRLPAQPSSSRRQGWQPAAGRPSDIAFSGKSDLLRAGRGLRSSSRPPAPTSTASMVHRASQGAPEVGAATPLSRPSSQLAKNRRRLQGRAHHLRARLGPELRLGLRTGHVLPAGDAVEARRRLQHGGVFPGGLRGGGRRHGRAAWLGEDAPAHGRAREAVPRHLLQEGAVRRREGPRAAGHPGRLRPDVSPIVVGALANRLAQHYEAVRGHDLETRRYMFKVDY